MMDSRLQSQDDVASGTLMGLSELENEFNAYSASAMSTPFMGNMNMTLDSPMIFQSDFDSQSNSLNINAGFGHVPKYVFFPY
jgi:hypothetical protein